MSDVSAIVPFVNRFVVGHPAEAARVLESAGRDAIIEVLGAQPPAAAAAVLRHVTAADAADVIGAMPADAASAALDALDPAAAARLLARLDADVRERLLAGLSKTARSEVESMLQYPPGTAGRLMDARVVALPADSSVATALDLIRQRRARLSDIPIVDRAGTFVGTVSLPELIDAPQDASISTLTARDAVAASVMAPHTEVVDLLTQYRLRSLPVIDAEGVLVGVLRHDALLRAAQSDAAADMQQMVGVGAQERALSSSWFAVRSRLPWLQINLLTAFLAAAVVGLFEDTIAQITALAVLLPVAAGQSGNTGAQALAVTMRGLALREIRTAHVWRVVRKEAGAGLLNGLAVALTSALGVWVWSRNVPLAALMAVAMIGSMFVASMAGALIPTILTALGRDPATASSIILTTVTDVIGFFIFLGLATVFANALIGG